MAANGTKRPSISVTLPLAREADPQLLQICLTALASQSFRDFEILVLLSHGAPQELAAMLAAFPAIKVFEGQLSKSQARNFLAERAAGEYLMYIDVDMELAPDVVAECHAKLTGGSPDAIIIPFRVANTGHLMRKCRSLEWELMAGDLGSEIPILVKASLFRQVGGFDEQLGLLDDWSLTSRLHSHGIQPDRIASPLFLRETVSPCTAARMKYERGRWLPALLEKYPHFQQAQIGKRFRRTYLRNWRVLVRSPFIAICLIALKVMEVSALTLGKMRPIRPAPADSSRFYLQSEVAESYDRIRLGDNFNRFKHYCEVDSLAELIPAGSQSLLEVGCGTGRITEVLAAGGHAVHGVDPSAAMLREYANKPDMPLPVRADGTRLPFADGCFQGAVSLRVIWHLPDRSSFRNFLAEMARVSSDYLIVDLASAHRWHHPLIRAVSAPLRALRPGFRDRHRTSQLLTDGEITDLTVEIGLRVERLIPLDVLSPLWLNLLPVRLAKALFPFHRKAETNISRLLPPGRYLAFMSKTRAD